MAAQGVAMPRSGQASMPSDQTLRDQVKAQDDLLGETINQLHKQGHIAVEMKQTMQGNIRQMEQISNDVDDVTGSIQERTKKATKLTRDADPCGLWCVRITIGGLIVTLILIIIIGISTGAPPHFENLTTLGQCGSSSSDDSPTKSPTIIPDTAT